MTTVKFPCPTPGCDYKTTEHEASIAIELLKLHVGQVHGTSSKPEKPKRPCLQMPATVIETIDWEAFKDQFANYKVLAGITGTAVNHLIECLSDSVYTTLFNSFGAAIREQTETQLLANIEHLVVRKRNRMASILEFTSMKQESDQRILSFASKLKSLGRHCAFRTDCSCGKQVDFTNDMVLFRLVAGLADAEIQEELLTKELSGLEEAEKIAVAMESAKASQTEIAGEKHAQIKSTYKKQKAMKCKWCGEAPHNDRKTECKAFGKVCGKCHKENHFRKVCLSKKADLSAADAEKKSDPESEEVNNEIIHGVFALSTEKNHSITNLT